MKRLAGLIAWCVLGLMLVLAAEVQAQGKAFKLNKEWKGSVADESLQKGAPEVIASAKSLEKLWKDWGIAGETPKIDFDKEIIILATTRGSTLNVSGKLNDQGDLQIIGFGTLDLRPSFRYVFGTVSREGVKTVNKKALPKD